MSSKKQIHPEILEKIVSALNNLEFGTVQITVHDSQVTQIEKVEKHRFSLTKSKNVKPQSNGK